jgi:hypothetical protein
LGAFAAPKTVTLTMQADGTGQVSMTTLSETDEISQVELPISQEQFAMFVTQLDQAHFWNMPTESSRRGNDGAEWILEAIQNGGYHTVVRWCPDITRYSADDEAFARAALLLLEFPGYKHTGNC